MLNKIKLQHNDNPNKAIKKAPLPYKEVGDKIIFNFKLSAKGTRKDDGKPFTQKPQIVDAKKRPMEDQQIWGDSILKIICEPYGWNMPIGIGCTLRLKVVQVVKLVTGKPQNVSFQGLLKLNNNQPKYERTNNKSKSIMPVNNIDKAMVGKGEMKVAEKDPMTHIDLELMDNMKRVFDEARKEGFKGTFKDFLDTLSEEDLKTLFLADGGPVKAKIKQPKEVKKINLSQYFEPGKLGCLYDK